MSTDSVILRLACFGSFPKRRATASSDIQYGHLEKLIFSERAIWIEERPAGFVVRDKNGSARFRRSRRALSRSRCQEGPAGCPERRRALGGVPRSVERGLAQAGGGTEERCRTQALGRDRPLQDAGSASALQSLR